VDDSGRPLRLGRAFGDRPVLLVLGYYRCTQLCGLLMHGLLEALHDGGLPRSAYRVLRVSIDPADTPAIARAARAADLAYADFLDPPATAAAPLDLRLLTGAEPALHALARDLGWRYQAADAPAGANATYAHPAVVAVLTPEGRVSRYLPGVRFDPTELRRALLAAGEGRIGGLSDRLALLCAHLDPRLGRHSAAVLQAVRAVGLLTALALLGFVARQAGRGRKTP
jgi:protein SCO1/2